MASITRYSFKEQIKNLNLFLSMKGKRLSKSNIKLYRYLLATAGVEKGASVTIPDRTIQKTMGWDEKKTFAELNELNIAELFDSIEINDDSYIIGMKNLEQYTRVQN